MEGSVLLSIGEEWRFPLNSFQCLAKVRPKPHTDDDGEVSSGSSVDLYTYRLHIVSVATKAKVDFLSQMRMEMWYEEIRRMQGFGRKYSLSQYIIMQ